jgi:putative transposase
MPNSEQRALPPITFGCRRFICNRSLADKPARSRSRESIAAAQCKAECERLREADLLALSNERLHLESAYRNFFRDNSTGFPTFKSKHRRHDSYAVSLVNGIVEPADACLKLPKPGRVKVKQRQVPADYR